MKMVRQPRIVRAFSIAASAVTIFVLIRIITAPLDESYLERVPVIMTVCLTSLIVVLSCELPWRRVFNERRPLRVLPSGIGVLGTIASLLLSVLMEWHGVLIALALLGFIAIASAAASIGTWWPQRIGSVPKGHHEGTHR